jgi:hypothetical protein
MREEESEGESVHVHVGRGVRVGGLDCVVAVAAVPERKDEGCLPRDASVVLQLHARRRPGGLAARLRPAPWCAAM